MSIENSKWPMVSVIVTNYNSREYLEQCLSSVLSTNYPNFEVIFVDNGSTDGSPRLVKESFGRYSRIKMILNKENLGAAKGKNMGIKIARGKYVALLDSDTKVDKGWLKEAISKMEADPTIGLIQCKLLHMDFTSRIDYAGDYLSPYGFLIQRAVAGKLVDECDEEVEIFAVKDAGAVARYDALEEAGLFDQDYFMYFEETDLCWRVWLRGYRIVFIPSSVVYHAVIRPSKQKSFQRQYLAQYYGTKNIVTTLVKNLGMWNLIRILPLHFALWLSIAIWYILKRNLVKARLVILGILWNIKNLRQVWKKRAIVQKTVRKTPDKLIMPRIMRKKHLIRYFYQKLKKWGTYIPIMSNITMKK